MEYLMQLKKYSKIQQITLFKLTQKWTYTFQYFRSFRQGQNFLQCNFRNSEIQIVSIDRIEIEYAPKPKEKYLNDGTSFDTYIEYTNFDDTKGMIGIEVKYTEKEYKLTANSKQEKKTLGKLTLLYCDK